VAVTKQKKHKERLHTLLEGAMHSAIHLHNMLVILDELKKRSRMEQMAFAQGLLLNGWSNDTGRN